MSFADWDDEKYAIGVQRVDHQHKHLFKLVNKLYEAMRSDENVPIGPILEDLESYTYEHFDSEQDYMEECGFAGDCAGCYEAHQDAHRAFEEEVSNLKEMYEAGEATVEMKTLRFVREWLSEHVGDVDQQIATYLEDGPESLEPKEMNAGQ